MSETIRKTLSLLHRGQRITVIYDGKLEDERLQITGTVVHIDSFWKTLQVNNIGIDFSEICEILV